MDQIAGSGELNETESEKSDEKLLEEAHARLKLSLEAEQENRKLALEDIEFSAGKQWPSDIENNRASDGRPCLVINRIPQFIQQVTNDQRQNRPSIKVHPVDSGADIETAKVRQGLIRHIEYNSNADVAYDTAFDCAVTGGFGYFRIVTDYADPLSFEQDIIIKRIRNQFSVSFDPFSQEPDGSDANYAFVFEDLSIDEYKAKYPDTELSDAKDLDQIGNQKPDWVSDNSVRVAEYFYKEFKKEELVLLNTGETLLAKDLPQVLPTGVEVASQRTALVPSIQWCKINGIEIIEKKKWVGKYIPIIPVYGKEIFIDGKRILEGVVRNAKDSQRMYNYWASAETEAIALAPRAPFIAAEGQLEGFESDWASANRRNHSVLKYKPTSLDGVPVPPPQRNAFEPAVQAITQARMLASDDLKATTGIYDASLGAQSNETSGVAIQRRNVQAQTSNFHFIDNLTRSLKHAGRVINDLIPYIYDTERVARIIGDDGEERIVTLNAPFEENGKPVLYAMDSGKYDVTVDVGPSFASKRQEAVHSMLEVTRAYPQIAQVAGDLMVKNMDWPGAQEIADRIKKTLPPNLVEDKGDKEIPPQVEAQLQQMGQMIEQLTGQLNEATQKIENKTIELESKERIEMKKLEVELEIKRAELDAKDSLALLNAEIAQINQRLELLQINEPIQDLPPEPDGAMGADPGMEQPQPTGGFSPGTHMEGI